MNHATHFNFSLGFPTSSLLVLLVLFSIGCTQQDTQPTQNKITNSPAVNYSLAEPIELPVLKSKKDFVSFTKGSSVAVVKFGAEWCPPCKTLTPELEKIAGYFQTEDVKIAEIDVDEVGDLASELRINTIPYTVVYYSGNYYTDITGCAPNSIASLIESLCQKTIDDTEELPQSSETVETTDLQDDGEMDAVFDDESDAE